MTYKSKKSQKQKGFTLVELAIVLVIIGLIVSGVLVGQDLIKAAELRATIKQHQDFQVAVNTFLGKYQGIPGDINGAKYGLDGGCAGTANHGDGDGLIEDSNGAILEHNGEISCFWANLTSDGKEMIKGVYDGHSSDTPSATINDVVGFNMPKLKTGGTGWGVFNDGADHWFTTGVVGSQANDLYVSTVDFVPLDAFDIDDKIDDGVPTAGDVQTVNGHATAINSQAEAGSYLTYTANAVSDVDCVNTAPTGPDEYQFSANNVECRLKIKMQTF